MSDNSDITPLSPLGNGLISLSIMAVRKLVTDQAVRELVCAPWEKKRYALFVVTTSGVGIVTTQRGETRYFSLPALERFKEVEFPDVKEIHWCFFEPSTEDFHRGRTT